MRRDGLIQFRVSGEEKARIAGLAEAAGLPVSEFVRGRALERVSGNRGGPSAASGGDEAESSAGRAPAPARASVLTDADVLEPVEVRVTRTGERLRVTQAAPPQAYRCPRGCDPGWRPTAEVRCPVCRSRPVPA